MKKSISILFLSILAFAAQAQTEKGRIIVGGSIGFSSQKQESATEKIFRAEPSAAYFVINNLAVGLGLGFWTAKSNSSNGEGKSTTLLVSPMARYYFTKVDKAKLFAQFDLGTGSSTYKYSNTKDQSQSVTTWSISAGPEWFLNNNVGLTTALYFRSTKNSLETDAKTETGLQIGFDIHL